MKASEAKVEMKVKGKNPFTISEFYVITKIFKTVCWVDHYNEKGIPTGYKYKGVRYSILTPML